MERAARESRPFCYFSVKPHTARTIVMLNLVQHPSTTLHQILTSNFRTFIRFPLLRRNMCGRCNCRKWRQRNTSPPSQLGNQCSKIRICCKNTNISAKPSSSLLRRRIWYTINDNVFSFTLQKLRTPVLCIDMILKDCCDDTLFRFKRTRNHISSKGQIRVILYGIKFRLHNKGRLQQSNFMKLRRHCNTVVFGSFKAPIRYQRDRSGGRSQSSHFLLRHRPPP